MESNASLADLFSHFDQKLQVLIISLSIKESDNKEEWQGALVQNVFSKLSSLRVALSLIKSRLREQKAALEKANILKLKMQSILEVANHAKENIPEHLPKNILPAPQVEESSETERVVSVKSSANTVSVPLADIQVNNTVGKKPPPSPAPASQKNEHSKNYVNILTVNEFEAVPKYMKGRLTYNQINAIIDEIDRTFEIKYKLLRQKKSTLPEKKKQTYNTYKEQENALSQGFPFIIDADLKENTNVRVDPTLRSIWVILRHCGRVKEIRGGGLVRFGITGYL